ncbi:mitochondrial ribosomal protein-like protein subunit S18 [Corynespora cassiicola Philippines]|uniref:Small ribosomal subunit protein uS11m n=1 Tax=Corynespora cassiicola Philippines TaxID=1448308 RepID=A0A2T2P5Z4_CORCC|nr:mitochondrial ribosomal protein-like protein subunit S18 [Corynespora cassiicola Philippines]
MGPSTAMRAFRSLRPSLCASWRPAVPFQSLSAIRPFSQSSPGEKDPATNAGMEQLMSQLGNVSNNFHRVTDSFGNIIPQQGDGYRNLAMDEWGEEPRHHFHIYSTKHNTHITFTKPNRDALISVSTGNIGFRKAGRGTYDAAYQLAAFVMSRIQDKGLLPSIKEVEVIYRGFGPGREAVTKAILGSEGKNIRPKIKKLSDSTRLKFGGVRSKKPRRLG